MTGPEERTPEVREAPAGAAVRNAAGGPRFRGLEAAALAVVVAVGGLLRFWNLDRVGFRGDEAVYAGQAAVLAGVEDLQRHFILMSRGNSNFLLFQRIVSLVYRVSGVSDVSARAVAASFSTLTIVVLFAVGRTLATRGTALLAALLLAVSSYSTALGRLALLDATLTFLVALAMLCLARWDRTGKPAWLYGFAAATALAIQAKIVGVLLVPVLAGYLLASRRRLALPVAALAAASFLVCCSPVLLNLAYNAREFGGFLSSSSQRVSHVSWSYYPGVLVAREGVVVVALWLAGLVVALARRSRADLLPGLWLLVFVGFYQLYPLKAFNYLLPSVPALCLLAARATEHLPRPSLPAAARLGAAGAAAAVLAAGVAPSQWRALHDDSFAGLAEAARWLAANSPPDAGVMTLSHGSAQYVFSFYARRDAYPFGRFRLATVLPGGRVVHPLPTSGGTPRDWVSLWPPRLLEEGTVSYLVYYATSTTIDDPEEDPLVSTSTQRKFRELVARYGGRLVHTVNVNHEGRAWIYKATRLRRKPVVTHTVKGGVVRVRGWGFAMSSPVRVVYHHRRVATVRADAQGSVTVRFRVPKGARRPWYAVLTDAEGNYASFDGLSGKRA